MSRWEGGQLQVGYSTSTVAEAVAEQRLCPCHGHKLCVCGCTSNELKSVGTQWEGLDLWPHLRATEWVQAQRERIGAMSAAHESVAKLQGVASQSERYWNLENIPQNALFRLFRTYTVVYKREGIWAGQKQLWKISFTLATNYLLWCNVRNTCDT